MYLEKVRSKGVDYLYLRKYDSKVKYGTRRKFVYGFGRLEQAREKMINWEKGKEKIPDELKKLGCTSDDIHQWIEKTSLLDNSHVIKETSTSAAKII